MELGKSSPQSFDTSGAGLEENHRFDFVGDFPLPPINRPGSWLDRATRHQSAIEQSANEFHTFLFVGDRGVDNYRIRMGQASSLRKNPVRR
jgi:hypothetical protein